jgi:hypothetical protein
MKGSMHEALLGGCTKTLLITQDAPKKIAWALGRRMPLTYIKNKSFNHKELSEDKHPRFQNKTQGKVVQGGAGNDLPIEFRLFMLKPQGAQKSPYLKSH